MKEQELVWHCVRRIMEKHHGFISAISDENEGSTFILSIPLQQPVV